MKYQLSEILMLNTTIQQALADPVPKKVKFSYALARNVKRIESVISDFVGLSRMVMHKHADKDENGSPVLDDNGNPRISDMGAYIAEMQGLQSNLVEVKLHRIPVDLLPDVMPSTQLVGLMPMLIEPDDFPDAP